jgi:PEP-CTERM motif
MIEVTMMERTNIFLKVTTALALALALSSAQALLLEGLGVDAGGGAASGTAIYDSTGATSGVLFIDKTFAELTTVDVNGNITEGDGIVSVFELISNDSGVDWLDYHLSLSFTPFTTGIAPLPSLIAGSITNNFFGSTTSMATTDGFDIWFEGGVVPDGAGDGSPALEVQFDFDVDPEFLGSFVIAQWPTTTGGGPTPEPATLALLGLGLAGVGVSRRKGKKA